MSYDVVVYGLMAVFFWMVFAGIELMFIGPNRDCRRGVVSNDPPRTKRPKPLDVTNLD